MNQLTPPPFLRVLDYSTTITAAHLQELHYPASDLEKYAAIINRQLNHQQCYPGEIRHRKDPSGTPFTFTVTNTTPYSMNIVVIFPKSIKGALLGVGGYQRVKKSITLQTVYLSSGQITVWKEKTALHRFKKGYNRKTAERTSLLHNALRKILPTAKIAEAPRTTRIYTSKSNATRIEMDSARYDQDLLTAMKKNKIDKIQGLSLLGDIGDTLQAFHDAGFVHGDVKLQNILVKTDQAGSYNCFLNDFELTAKSGHCDSRTCDYPYWDACSVAGISLPNSDIYGLTKSAFEVLTCSLKKTPTTKWLSKQGNAETLFRSMLPQFNGTRKTIPELLTVVDTFITDQDKLKLAKARGKIILMMAREERNSELLFNYYQTKRNDYKNIKEFLVSAKSAIPTLSKAHSLAAELREIHQILTG